MNTPRVIITCVLALALAALPLTVIAHRFVGAKERAHSARTSLVQAVSDAQEIMELRAKRETIQARPRPQQDVIAQVNASFGQVGIPERTLRSLTPQSDRPATNALPGSPPSATGLRLQSLQLELVGLTPEQLGAWLVHWRLSQSVWRLTRLDLVHARNPDHDTNCYDATILLCATYLDNGTSPAENQ